MRGDADMSSSFGVSTPFAESTTAFAFWKTSFFSASKYVTPVARPSFPVSTRLT